MNLASPLRERVLETDRGLGERAVLSPAESLSDNERLFAVYLFPVLGDFLSLLRRLSIPVEQAALLAAQAISNGTDFQSELLGSGLVGEVEFYRALACDLGLEYADEIDPDQLIVSESLNQKDRLDFRVLRDAA
jgi:hypothetical protein